MADTTASDALHAELTERLDWHKAKLERVRQGVNSPSTVAASEHEVAFYERIVAALVDTVPRDDDALIEARAERDAYRSDAEAWRRHMAQQASVDNATPPRYATGGIVTGPQVFDPVRAWAERHPALINKTTALAEDREADPTDDCD